MKYACAVDGRMSGCQKSVSGFWLNGPGLCCLQLELVRRAGFLASAEASVYFSCCFSDFGLRFFGLRGVAFLGFVFFPSVLDGSWALTRVCRVCRGMGVLTEPPPPSK